MAPAEFGGALYFDTLDEQFNTLTVLEVAFNLPSQRERGRKGGKVRSEAKAVAVRANGAKGGRPRKVKDILPLKEGPAERVTA